jgi:3-oxoacyl-[acyl-carrier-protein] synthase III
MDYTGRYGVGPNTFFIPFETNIQGKRIEKFLKSEDYKTMALATRVNRQYLKHAFIQHLSIDKIIKTTNTKTKKTTNTKTKKTKKKTNEKRNKTRKNKKIDTI